MHDDREQLEVRIRRTISDRIRPHVHGPGVPVEVSAWDVPGEPVPVAAARERVAAGDLRPFAVGGRWGRPWGTTWFRLQGQVPPAGAGESVELLVDLFSGVGPGFQSEGLLFRTDAGGPIRGIHPRHQAIPVGLVADDDGRIDVLVEAAANPVVATSYRPTPLGDPATAGDELQYRLNRAELAARRDDVWHLDLDLQVLGGLMRQLGLDDPRRYEMLRVIDAAVDAYDPSRPAETAADARAVLEPLWARHATDHAHRVSAVGHAHIDTAWLWPLRETVRKCTRTFASAVTLMDEYPEHRFACSQAAQWAWIEEHQPELFARISEKVAEGRFLPVGSMWVEADANLPSGESLARQLAWGRRWFEERFGEQPGNRTVWIPDVFGYAGNLPQLMAQAGCDSFLTQKLSWNQTNAFPHHTFWWEGIDGTRIFTHFPPADTYNGEVVPSELAYAVRNLRDKGSVTRSMYLFGHGDGGGGPTREMLERARRIRAGGRGLDGLPRLEIESPAELFAAARAEHPDAPVWRGELYFEMHRGTYTTQAETKRGNRRGELALRELELWTAPGAPAGAPAPLADLERLWKVLLLHQFHDIIPGSSIAWVHDDTEAAHAELLAEVDRRIADALPPTPPPTRSGREIGIPGDRSRDQNGWVGVANAAPFALAGVVDGPDGPVWADAPAHGVGTGRAGLPAGVAPCRIEGDADHVVLANGLVSVAIAPDGTLSSVRDHRADREVLAGPGNVLQLFPDLPNTYDAWDVEAHTLRLPPTLLTEVEHLEVVEQGDLRVAVRVRRAFGRSTVEQTYVLRAGSARVDVVTDVDWQESEKLLKAAFPLDLRADDARYDVQFGHVRRPTHRNTSWDAARFEVCAHQWADVSEPGFGAALLNDGRYGHDCLGDATTTTMRLSLLRAPRYPDPEADRGPHRVTYSLLPHDGTLREVLPEAWHLNVPARMVDAGPSGSVAAVDHPGVVVTAVKAADDGSGDLVVRLHEALGGRARTTLRTAATFASAVRADLLERPVGEPAAVVDGGVALELRPFEVRTLRLRA